MRNHYWSDGDVTLYHGKADEVLAELKTEGVRADVAVVDPPYADTHHSWDSWPDGWPTWVAGVTDSMWCFGSARMFDTDRFRDDLRAQWRMAFDVIWAKNAGTANRMGDRFTRTHEHIRHYYRKGVKWGDVYHQPDRERGTSTPGAIMRRSAMTAAVHGPVKATSVVMDGKAFLSTVRRHNKIHRRGIHPSQKPTALLGELITFGAPVGGLVIDPMSGSGSTGKACQIKGRRAILIEQDEALCEASARWLAQPPMVTEIEEGPAPRIVVLSEGTAPLF